MMSLGQSEETREKQVCLFFPNPFCRPRGRAGRPPGQGMLGKRKGCQARPTANMRSSHLCFLKPGVLPKASFWLCSMVTLDEGQFLRASSYSLRPHPLVHTHSLTELPLFAFKGSLTNIRQSPWKRKVEHKKKQVMSHGWIQMCHMCICKRQTAAPNKV